MKFCHTSDTHGLLLPLPGDCDMVIHTGDMLPSFSRGVRAIEVPRQTEWVRTNRKRLRNWAGDRKMYFVEGNHDYIHIGEHLRAIGIDAHSLPFDGRTDDMVGFSYVPAFTREWNFELEHGAMQDKISSLEFDLENNPAQILAMHCPPHRVLDRNHSGQRCGSLLMREMLIALKNKPRVVLCGHIHESQGRLDNWHGMIVSNAACMSRVIEL